MSPWVFWLCLVGLIGSGLASDVPFVIGENISSLSSYSSAQLKQASYSSSDLIGIPLVGYSQDNRTLETSLVGSSTSEGILKKEITGLKDELSKKVETGNPRIHEDAILLASKYPGDLTIDQICEIYFYLKYGDGTKRGWVYIRDPRGIDSWNYANESLQLGDRANSVGAGDLDDFAILIASLIESIGGTTRIILANNDSIGSHIYTEVYIGQLDDPNYQVEKIIKWLQQEFNLDKIYVHIDTDTKKVWLNLDWGPDQEGNAHLGGPFFPGDWHNVLYIRDNYEFIPLRIPEAHNMAPRLISLVPDKNSPQEAGSVINWTAKASDADSDQILYRFLLNGYAVTNWKSGNSWTWATTEADMGTNQIEVLVIDGKHAGPNAYDSKKTINFSINEIGVSTDQQIDAVAETVEALGAYSPTNPLIGEAITFDASKSRDKSGRIIDYEWDFGDGYFGKSKSKSIKHVYLNDGIYNVKLTATNDKGEKNSSFININVTSKKAITVHANVTPNTGSIYTLFTYTISAESPYKDRFDIELQIKPKGSDIWESQGVQTYSTIDKKLVWPNLSISNSIDILGICDYRFIVDDEEYWNFIGPEIDVIVRNESFKMRKNDNFDYSAEVKSSRPYVDMELLYTDDDVTWIRSGQIQRYILDNNSSAQPQWITLTWQDQPWHKSIRVDERRVG